VILWYIVGSFPLWKWVVFNSIQVINYWFTLHCTLRSLYQQAQTFHWQVKRPLSNISKDILAQSAKTPLRARSEHNSLTQSAWSALSATFLTVHSISSLMLNQMFIEHLNQHLWRCSMNVEKWVMMFTEHSNWLDDEWVQWTCWVAVWVPSACFQNEVHTHTHQHHWAEYLCDSN